MCGLDFMVHWFTRMNFVDAKTYIAKSKGETLMKVTLERHFEGDTASLRESDRWAFQVDSRMAQKPWWGNLSWPTRNRRRTLDCPTVTRARAAHRTLEEGAGRGKGLGV